MAGKRGERASVDNIFKEFYVTRSSRKVHREECEITNKLLLSLQIVLKRRAKLVGTIMRQRNGKNWKGTQCLLERMGTDR